MRTRPVPLIPLSWLFIPLGAAGVSGMQAGIPELAGVPGSDPGVLFSAIVTHLGISSAIVFMVLLGLYAYASLARLAPYHTWIYLYLISLTGIAWALFIAIRGHPLSDPVFIITTVAGVNLLVHIFRFDRIQIILPAPASSVPG